jgi:hypothetical protein
MSSQNIVNSIHRYNSYVNLANELKNLPKSALSIKSLSIRLQQVITNKIFEILLKNKCYYDYPKAYFCSRVVTQVDCLAPVDPFIGFLQKYEGTLHRAASKINLFAKHDLTEILTMISLLLEDLELTTKDTRLLLSALKERGPLFKQVTLICKEEITPLIRAWVQSRLHKIAEEELQELQALQTLNQSLIREESKEIVHESKSNAEINSVQLQASQEFSLSSENGSELSQQLIVNENRVSSSWSGRFSNLSKSVIGTITNTGMVAIKKIGNGLVVSGNIVAKGAGIIGNGVVKGYDSTIQKIKQATRTLEKKTVVYLPETTNLAIDAASLTCSFQFELKMHQLKLQAVNQSIDLLVKKCLIAPLVELTGAFSLGELMVYAFIDSQATDDNQSQGMDPQLLRKSVYLAYSSFRILSYYLAMKKWKNERQNPDINQIQNQRIQEAVKDLSPAGIAQTVVNFSKIELQNKIENLVSQGAKTGRNFVTSALGNDNIIGLGSGYLAENQIYTEVMSRIDSLLNQLFDEIIPPILTRIVERSTQEISLQK